MKKIEKNKLNKNGIKAESVLELIKLLKLFPKEYKLSIYEGELVGINIEDERKKLVDFIRIGYQLIEGK